MNTVHETVLITDSGCDLSLEMLQDVGVEVLFFPYTLDGEEHFDDFGRTLSYDAFYDALQAGARSTTAQVRPVDCEAAFQRAYDLGKTALLVTLSSGLSASYDTALTVRERFLQKNPDAKIYVVDSLSVSAGQGLLVLEIANRLAAGVPAEDVVAWAEDNRLRVNHLFTVDSFEYLVRGGRVSPAVGAAGSMLNIKPVMHVDAEGHLAPLKKLRGRHRALAALSEMVVDRIEDPETQTIVIDHARCPEDAVALRDMLTDRIAVGGVIADRIGIIIGTHVGPGGLVVAFWGRPRGS
ncbi:MAG: DegV family protein [Coriobacteriia bacterium]